MITKLSFTALLAAAIASPALAAEPLYLLPPVEYDKPWPGELKVYEFPSYETVNEVCDLPSPALGCAKRVNDLCIVVVPSNDYLKGRTFKVFIPAKNNAKHRLTTAMLIRHEIGHCHGWPGNHAQARAWPRNKKGEFVGANDPAKTSTPIAAVPADKMHQKPAPLPAAPLSERTVYHNGSVMTAIELPGRALQIVYAVPKPELAAIGVMPGTLLIDGVWRGQQFIGRARVFNLICGELPYDVSGGVIDGALVLEGPQIRVDQWCQPLYAEWTVNSYLVFTP